jgi:hypothetical protein
VQATMSEHKTNGAASGLNSFFLINVAKLKQRRAFTKLCEGRRTKRDHAIIDI